MPPTKENFQFVDIDIEDWPNRHGECKQRKRGGGDKTEEHVKQEITLDQK